MAQYYVGMDVHSKESVFVMMDGKGKLCAQGVLATTPEGFQRWQGQYFSLYRVRINSPPALGAYVRLGAAAGE
jgi:hypothetical protein